MFHIMKSWKEMGMIKKNNAGKTKIGNYKF